jgi:hypothetical protein
MAEHHEEKEHRLEHLMSMRADLFQELEQLENDLVRLRMRIEHLESDIRLGAPQPEGYDHLKGHDLPAAEARIVATYNNLLKVEDKILFTRMDHS